MSYRRVETQTGFHARIIKQCETLSEIYDRRAAAAGTDNRRQRWQSKADAERRNAELHRRKMDELSSGLIG